MNKLTAGLVIGMFVALGVGLGCGYKIGRAAACVRWSMQLSDAEVGRPSVPGVYTRMPYQAVSE